MMSKSPDVVTFVVFGRTGSGKSSLGNKMAGKTIFKEGDNQFSETSFASSEEFGWILNPSVRVKFIDTPGFGDNRPGIKNADLLTDILKVLDRLKGGFHIGLFCIPGKTRIDDHDIEELEMLEVLLGHEVFKHTWIVITRTNTLLLSEKEKLEQSIIKDLPNILKQHDITDFPANKILFADFDNFQERFLKPIDKIIAENHQAYKIVLAEGLDLNDPKSIENCLLSGPMKQMADHYAQLFERKQKELEAMNAAIKDQCQKNEKLQKKFEKREEEINSLNEKVQQMKELSAAQNEKVQERMKEMNQLYESQMESLKQSTERERERMQEDMERYRKQAQPAQPAQTQNRSIGLGDVVGAFLNAIFPF